MLQESSNVVHRGVPYAGERWEQQQQLPRGAEDRKTRRKRSDPMKWITRERAKVDRIACPWLISRFIDPQPEFLYVPADQVLVEAATQEAIPYDIPHVELGHKGPLCSFDA